MGTLVRVVALAALVGVCATGVQAYTVAPEVFWFTIASRGQRCGFGRGQYDSAGPGNYQFKYVLVLHLPTSKTGEVGDYRFDQTLRPLSFTQKTLYTNRTQAVTNTADGSFDWPKNILNFKATEFGQDKTVDVPLTPGVVSLFSTNIALAHAHLTVGQKLEYTVFSSQMHRLVKQHFEVLAKDRSTGQFKFRLIGDDAPDRERTFWFVPPTPKHPNGYTTLTTFTTADGMDIRMQASNRADALRGFEEEAASMHL